MSSVDLQKIQNDLKNSLGDYSLSSSSSSSSKKKSAAWECFQKVIDKNGNEVKCGEKDVVACRKCFHTATFSSKSGTSNLMTHLKKCYGEQQASEIPANSVEKDEMKVSLIKFVTFDHQPFEAIARKGFLSAIQGALKLQHNRATLLKAEDLCVHPTTVARGCSALAGTAREQMKAYFSQFTAKEFKCLNFSLDCWQDNMGEVSFFNFPNI